MSRTRIITAIVALVSLLLALKLLLDRRGAAMPVEPDAAVQEEIPPVPRLPVRYALGEVDPRFGISPERYLELAREAESVWENASGKILFEFDPDASVKLNLIFDWRQEKLLAAKEAKAKIDAGGTSFDEMQADYDARSKELDKRKREYDDAAERLRVASEEYTERVKRWNEAADHPDDEYRRLQTRREELEDERNALGEMGTQLNSGGEALDRFGAQLKERAKEYNLDVENFNGTFVQSRDFEKGVFDGKSISIYEFDRESDLKLTLIHEFGHALGLGHLENPKAIMNRKLAAQDLDSMQLTHDDLKLLEETIR